MIMEFKGFHCATKYGHMARKGDFNGLFGPMANVVTICLLTEKECLVTPRRSDQPLSVRLYPTNGLTKLVTEPFAFHAYVLLLNDMELN